MATIIQVPDRARLRELIKETIAQQGVECDLNHLDVSRVVNMDSLFARSPFKGDISKWDVSNVTSMTNMFNCSSFNGDISQWTVSQVTDMRGMFASSKFKGDLSNWDVSKVTNMSSMFQHALFNGDISRWNVSNVSRMDYMFDHSAFRGSIEGWQLHDDCSYYRAFSVPRPNPLAVSCLLKGYMSTPQKLTSNPAFQEALSLAKQLDLNTMQTAEFICQRVYQRNQHRVTQHEVDEHLFANEGFSF